MDKITLKADKRTVFGRKIKKLRTGGVLPANIYGKKIKSTAIQVPEKDFLAVFSKAGETGLVEVQLEKEKLPVLVHNIQYHPVTGKPLHADFYQVDLKEKVTAKVPLVLVGEAPAVKDKIGVILQSSSEVEVEALPADLIDKIEVDIGKLAVIGEGIKVSDLKVSDKIRILTDINREVVKIAPLVSKEAEKMVKEAAEAQAAAAAQAAATTATAGPAEGGATTAPTPSLGPATPPPAK